MREIEQIIGRPQWKTPAGRSRRYVEEICSRIGKDNIELGNGCTKVAKIESEVATMGVTSGEAQAFTTRTGWKVTDSKGAERIFDKVSLGRG